MENATSERLARMTVKELTINGLFIGLTLVFTAFINIRLPIAANGGLIHLGNIPLFIGAVLYGKRTGALAGGIGMGLFDILSGWTAWAPFTMLIVGLMGYTIGKITEVKKGFGWNFVAIALAALIKVIGYYFAEVILYSNWITPFGSIPGNLIQVGMAALIALPVLPMLGKIVKEN